MKVFILIMIMALIVPLQGIAQIEKKYYSRLPDEDPGYMVYESIDYRGKKVFVKTPVASSGRQSAMPDDDEDANISYRDCRIELSRARQERKAGKRLSSAAYYPLYLDY